MSTTTHYEVLGVAQDATAEDITRAYRRFARTHHPDIADPQAAQTFAAGNLAHDVLSNPDARAAYDNELRNPTPPADETPVDDWFEDSGWDDTDEPLDVPVEDVTPPPVPPQPTPQPGTPGPPSGAGSGSQAKSTPQPANTNDAAEPVDPTVVDNVPHPSITAAAGILAATPPAVIGLGTINITQALLIGVAGVVLAAAVFLWQHTQKRSKPVTMPLRSTPPAVGAIALLAATATAIASTRTENAAAFIASLIPALFAGALTGDATHVIHQDRRIFKKKDLREYNRFGSPPPGAAAALVNRAIEPALWENRAIKVVQSAEPNAFFSHALINGTTITLLRGVASGDGYYQWSGASLLRETPTDGLVEVLSGDYATALRRIRRTVPAATFTPYVVVVSPRGHVTLPNTINPTSSTPGVVDATDLLATLQAQEHARTVSRTVMTATVRAMVDQTR